MGERSWWALALVLGCGPKVALDGGETSGSATRGTSGGGETVGGVETLVDPADSGDGPSARTSTTTVSATNATATTSEDGVDETEGADTTTGVSPATANRLLVIYTPHGYPGNEPPFGPGTPQFDAMLAPIADWSDDTLIVDYLFNVRLPPDDAPIEDAHDVAAASLLTGGLMGSRINPKGGPYFGGGPSMDVVIGEALGDDVPRSFVHLGPRAPTWDPDVPYGVSYLGVDAPNLPYTSPATAFEALFADLAPDDALEALAELVAPQSFTSTELTQAHAALAVAALRYDQTRSVLFSIDEAIPRMTWPEYGVPNNFHWALTGFGFPAEDPTQVVAFFGQTVADVLGDLQDSPASDGGTLLDHTIVVWVSEFGAAPGHFPSRILAVVVDTTGRFTNGVVAVDEFEADQADFAATIGAVLGVPLEGFGHPSLGATPIEALLNR